MGKTNELWQDTKQEILEDYYVKLISREVAIFKLQKLGVDTDTMENELQAVHDSTI